MNIFEALMVSHLTQRELSARLTRAVNQRDVEETARVFQELKEELVAHETAEERCFYVPLFEHDSTVDASRHAIAEHHQMDEMVESLDEMDPNVDSWRDCARKLVEKIDHHLTEEEQKFFAQAGQVLTDEQKLSLAKDYEAEFLTIRTQGLQTKAN